MEAVSFGRTKEGQETYLYTLQNKKNMRAAVTNYGARLVSVCVPDREGNIRDVVLGYDDVTGYENDGYCFGAVIGRNANRMKNAEFTLNGVTYHLEKNEGENNCHSGPNGYQFRIWEVEKAEESMLRLSLVSPEKDQGFPGEFRVTVTYSLTEENELLIHYEGRSTEDTVVNMTHHSYFNLNGHDSGKILEQKLRINARTYSPIEDEQSIPTGEYAPVAGTPMDFRTFKRIGQDIEADFPQLIMAGDYNHSFHLDKGQNEMGLMAEAYSETSGIYLKAETNLPEVQLYTGYYIEETRGKNHSTYGSRHGFCLEAQYTPNAVNQEQGEKPTLSAGEKYDKLISYQFGLFDVKSAQK